MLVYNLQSQKEEGFKSHIPTTKGIFVSTKDFRLGLKMHPKFYEQKPAG